MGMDVVQGELRQDFIALLPCVVSPATQPRAVAKLLTVAECVPPFLWPFSLLWLFLVFLVSMNGRC